MEITCSACNEDVPLSKEQVITSATELLNRIQGKELITPNKEERCFFYSLKNDVIDSIKAFIRSLDFMDSRPKGKWIDKNIKNFITVTIALTVERKWKTIYQVSA